MAKPMISVREMCIVSIFTAITAVLSPMVITLPFTPIPISFGIAAVYIAGMLQRPKCALLSMLCYLLLGTVGVPVFSYFRGGPQVIVGQTGGYLMVYPLVAWLVAQSLNGRGRAMENGLGRGLYVKTALTLTGGVVIFYLAGTLWMSFVSDTGFVETLASAALPFIPVDIIKIICCTVGILPLRDRMLRMGLLR